MEEMLNKILSREENINKDFAVHIKNENELNTLIKVIENKNFTISLNLFNETLRKWMVRVAKEDNFNTCFRLRNREEEKSVSYNPSIEHWRLYCDVIEFDNDKVVFNEGKYTKEAAEIEADKIINDINEGTYLKKLYGNKTRIQIIEELINH